MFIRFQEPIKDMGFPSPSQTPSLMRTGLIVLSLIAGVGVGMSIIIFPFPYSSLITIGAVAAAVILIISIRNPVWALFTALFVALFPIGLIPPEVQSIVNRCMVFLALFTWLVGVVTRRCRIRWTITTSLMATFLLWATFTLLWTGNLDMGTTILFVYTARLIFYLLLIPSEIKTRKDLDGLMKTLAIGGWVLILVSLGVVLLEGYIPGSRLQVLKTNANELGMIVLLTMAGVLWQALQPAKQNLWFKKMVALIFLLMAIIVVAMSGSRGSAISLIIAFLAFLLCKPTRSWGKKVFFILIVAAIFAPFIFSTLLERFGVRSGDTVLGGRELIWQGAWQLISEHSFFGVGIGNSRFAIVPFLNIMDADGVPVHNPILAVLSETGFLGIILYLSVLVSAGSSFLQQYQRCQRQGVQWLIPYFSIVGSVFLGYLASWVKGGGMESHFGYFLALGLLLIPAHLDIEGLEGSREFIIESPEIAKRLKSQTWVLVKRSRYN